MQHWFRTIMLSIELCPILTGGLLGTDCLEQRKTSWNSNDESFRVIAYMDTQEMFVRRIFINSRSISGITVSILKGLITFTNHVGCGVSSVASVRHMLTKLMRSKSQVYRTILSKRTNEFYENFGISIGGVNKYTLKPIGSRIPHSRNARRGLKLPNDKRVMLIEGGKER